jgi:hypothetical protein
MTFRVGQKVVCVDATSGPFTWLPGEAPTEGAIYTVARLSISPLDGVALMELCEITRHKNTEKNWGHKGYGQYRFRPVVENKSSISFTMGAPKDSEKFDNRKKQKERA